MAVVVCHGGSASDPRHKDGPRFASLTGLEVIANGQGALAAAVAATQMLEDDDRFNAGTGSNLRLDGVTIQMDAACMTSAGEFGAVAAIERVKNPVAVARCVLQTPHILLAGDGATAFARRCGFDDFDPATPAAKARYRRAVSATGRVGEWSRDKLESVWNFATRPSKMIGGDTVGCVAWDGSAYAGALSSGGTTTVLRGRVGDVPLPGGGLYVGELGGVAVTGDGEHLARQLLAYRAYSELERGRLASEVVEWALRQLADHIDVGIIVVTRGEFAGGARHDMAWHGQRAETTT